MAFIATDFIPNSAMANSNASRIFSYTTVDAIAAVIASGYFDAAGDPTGGLGLTDGDVILATASDVTQWLQVDVTAGTVTIDRSVAFT